MYLLLNVDAQAPLIPNNDGTISGQAIRLQLLRVAPGIQPFKCEAVSYSDGSVKVVREVGLDVINGQKPATATTYDLLWHADRGRWVLYFAGGSAQVQEYGKVVKALWK